MSQNENFNLSESQKSYGRNPASVLKVKNPVTYSRLFSSRIAKPIMEKAEHAIQNGEKILSENILKDFAIKLAESHEHGEMYNKSFPRIAAQIGDDRLVDAVADVVKALLNEGLTYGTAFELRFDVFSEEFVQALKASDNDGQVVKHLQIYVKYRNFSAS